MKKKINEALSQIKCNSDMSWFVPNREMLNMTLEEFIEFERARILEFDDEKIKKTKYKSHFESLKNE